MTNEEIKASARAIVFDSEVEGAIRDAVKSEREECCKDVCDFCAKGVSAIKLGGMTMTRRSKGEGCSVWGHRLTADGGIEILVPCAAQDIRGRGERMLKPPDSPTPSPR